MQYVGRLMLARVVIAGSLMVPVTVAADRESQQQPSLIVPPDLKPLLAAPASEMRLVVTRYQADRGALAGNYAGPSGAGRGGGRRGGGAAPAVPPPPPVPLSPARLSRLKRFDLDWQAALAKLDTSRLSPAAAADLSTLKAGIDTNLKQIEADALTMAQVRQALPFAARIVGLVEARIGVQDVDGRKAAETTMAVIKDVKAMRAALESGEPASLNKATALRAADGTDQLRAGLTEWFGFYNGYDPLVSWWMGMPFKQASAALQDYATFLRDKVAAADAQVASSPASVPPVEPAPAPKYASVPDLASIIALPQDEMRDVVTRFNTPRRAGNNSGRGGAMMDAAPAPPPPDNAFYNAWLAALKTLDFDALSRNAQVDYLFIKRTAETEIARAGFAIETSAPRKTDNTGIPGAARGRNGLIADLSDNMIPYSPEQLIALANKEYEWCEKEMKKASREMGYGDDWKKAVEHTKNTFVPPGGQPRMIMDLLDEAVAYLRATDLITVPAVAAESLHMIMMSPEAQLTNPFFLGGSQIIVSYPTDTMDFDARMQSMRGNNPGFSHATAFHEMIPGHNLVGYLNQRYADYRPDLTSGGPFYGEGWPLYWELTMYELGFHRTPEQKIGALFWRMHRCARIIFSLKFHMGQWSPQECIDFLVDKVGHERDNATAEVRRSFQGGYGPLYQAAYLLGGLQLRGLRQQLVDTKIMTNKQFHDEILRQGNMPIALIRLAVTREKLTRDMDISWKFYGDLPDK
jgi:hypothetical protein